MLAGYISANRVDLARVKSRGKGMIVFDEKRYSSSEHSSLESILAHYLGKNPATINDVCLGVAGPVLGDEVSPTNLPWTIVGESLERQFNFGAVQMVNDIVATAHGLSHLGPDKFFVINKGHEFSVGNQGLIAAGSGLGEAIIHREQNSSVPYASEGGHADFAPGSQIESELWEYLYADQAQVEAEDVISWTGLERIFSFLTDTQGFPRREWYDSAVYKAAAIIEKALAGEDETASQTLEMFTNCYASEAANLALKGMTIGGVFVGGQIAPRIITALDKGRFMQRFVKKGKMEALLSSMPVKIVIEDRTALIGAAAIVNGTRAKNS
ncbi:MAG: glucokinase [candidate division Zixibacteria bacterium]